MKKLILLIGLLLVTSMSFAQKIKVDVVKYKFATTAERDALVVPANETWKLWNTTTSKWEYWSGASWEAIPKELIDLADVSSATPTTGFALMGNGVDFGARLLTEADISDLLHFTPTNLLTDYGFVDNSVNWNLAFTWGDHSTFNYSTGAHIQSAWQLNDVQYESLNVGELLQWNGSNWVNKTFAELNLFTGAHTPVSDAVYSAAWDADSGAASKNSIYDKIESLTVGGGTDDQIAAEVPFTPNGSIAATNVQAAIQEVRDEAGGATLTQEQVEDYVGNMTTGSAVETLISVVYQDNGVGVGVLDHTVNPDLSLYNNTTSGFISSEVDGSTTNELQVFDVAQLVGSNLQLSLSNDSEATKIIDLSSLGGGGGFTQEQIEDFVGDMVSLNTETLIGVTYDDVTGTLDFIVDNDLSNYDNTSSNFTTGAHITVSNAVYGIGWDGDMGAASKNAIYDKIETVVAGGGGVSELIDLTDVNTSTPTNRNVLVADGIDFESRPLVEADISDLSHTTDTNLNEAAVDAFVANNGYVVQSDAQFSGTGTAIALDDNVRGKLYNVAIPSAATAFTTNSPLTGGFAQVFINTATEPTVDGSSALTGGNVFEANVDMVMVVYTPDGSNIFHYFIHQGIPVAAGGGGAASDVPYAISWDGNLDAATKNVIYDKLETIAGGTESTSVTDTAEIDLTLTGTAISGDLKNGSIDETRLDASTNASLNLADSALQSEVDGSVTNELQTISYAAATDIITLSNGGGSIDITEVDTNTQLSSEQVEDIIGAMLIGNTATRITVTYQDITNDIDFIVDDDLSNYNNSVSGFLTSEVDGSTTNEIQTLNIAQLVGTQLQLSLLNDGEATKAIELISIDDDDGVAEIYGASWNGDNQAPTKNDVYDKIETVVAGGGEATNVGDTAEIDLTLTGTTVTADIFVGSIDETKLDASTNVSLNLADTALQNQADVIAVGFTPGAHTLDDDDGVAEVYGVGWNGDGEAPTKNDVYNKIEALGDGSTNLSIGTPASATTVTIESDTGTNAIIPEATGANAGALSVARLNQIIVNNGKVTDDDLGVSGVYGVAWNGDSNSPTKNDVYDKIELLAGGGGDAYLANTQTFTGINTFSNDFTYFKNGGISGATLGQIQFGDVGGGDFVAKILGFGGQSYAEFDDGFATISALSGDIDLNAYNKVEVVKNDIDTSTADLLINQSSTGDAFQTITAGGTSYSFGVDNSDLDQWKFAYGTDLTTNPIYRVGDAGNELYFDVNNIYHFTNRSLTTTGWYMSNSGTGDIKVTLAAGLETYTFGVDNSDGDKFKISNTNVVGTEDMLVFDPGTYDALFTSKVEASGDVIAGNGDVLDVNGTTSSGGTAFYLGNNVSGRLYGVSTPTSDLAYTTTDELQGGYAQAFINTASQPSIASSTIVAASPGFTIGVEYTIEVVGTTDFTLIGASANTVGIVFTATAGGTGTGTARVNSVQTGGQPFIANTDMSMVVYTHNGTDVKHYFVNQGAPLTEQGTAVSGNKAITIENPTSSEDITLFYTNESINFTKFVTVLNGSSTPSVSYNVRYAADRNSVGTALMVLSSVTTSTTTGDEEHNGIEGNIVKTAIPAGNWVWIETTAQSGTVDAFHLTMHYYEN